MERVAFLIEKTNQCLTCLLNPEDGFTIERSSGVTRETQFAPSRSRLTDDPVTFRSRGDTRLNLKLLFDIDLAAPRILARDVRQLTHPIWQLAEYATALGASEALPRVRFIWGQSWNIPVVVEAVAERFERFTSSGVPQRSWMTLRLLRMTEETSPVELPSLYSPEDIPEFTSETLPGTRLLSEDPSWSVHELLGGDTEGESLWQIAAKQYGDSSLWRLIARVNQIDDPTSLPAGMLLRLPPLNLLRARS